MPEPKWKRWHSCVSWAALDEVYPTTKHQRCWNHRITNVQAKLPKRLQKEARRRLREMAEAPTQKECDDLRDRYVAELLAADQRAAAPMNRGTSGLGRLRHLLSLPAGTLATPQDYQSAGIGLWRGEITD